MFDSRGDRGVDGVLPGHIHLDRIGRRPDLRRRLSRPLDIDVGDGDRGALADVGFGKSAADTPRRSGDQRALSFKTFHRIASPFSSNLWRRSASGVR